MFAAGARVSPVLLALRAALVDGDGRVSQLFGHRQTQAGDFLGGCDRQIGVQDCHAVSIAAHPSPISNVIDDVLETAANTVRSWRAEPALKLADYLAELSRFLPPELVSAAAQTSDLTASNVPGIPVPVWLAGARVERMYPLVGTIGAAINVTMLTYTDTASVGMSSDDAAVGDRAELLESLRVGFREVVGESAFIGDPISGQ